jgi:two-component system nitrogen regulation response regulator GlnG
MPTQTDPDLTVPSLIAPLQGKYGSRNVMLTVIFHPDSDRIGHWAVVPRNPGKAPWILGRRSPAFTSPDGNAPAPLEDPHVSRRALRFEVHDRRLSIARFEGSSRCRVGRAELFDGVEITWEELSGGVPLMLGHSIVLLLHLGRPGHAPVDAPGEGDCLRGGSSCMAEIRAQVARAGRADLDVLVRGETGTGKELVATAIHRASPRRAAPMVSVNMAAIPAELAAAALFGSARGAFTGAERATAGYFQQAQGGTLFLDEVGDTPAEVQPQLLRALQQREIQVVGGVMRKVDVRVVSATDADLGADGGNFKAALRHRLGACEIHLPPLREHAEDIGELLANFLARSASDCGRTGLLPRIDTPAPDIAAWAMLFYTFLQYPWPGNVRELKNFAQQVVLASERSPVMDAGLRAAFDASPRTGPEGLRRRGLRNIAREDFDQAMADNGFEVMRVARQLGVSRAAVYRRISDSAHYRLANAISPEELRCALDRHGGDSAAVARDFRVSLHTLRSRLRDLQLDWY